MPTGGWCVPENTKTDYKNNALGGEINELTFLDKMKELHWAMYELLMKSSPKKDDAVKPDVAVHNYAHHFDNKTL